MPSIMLDGTAASKIQRMRRQVVIGASMPLGTCTMVGAGWGLAIEAEPSSVLMAVEPFKPFRRALRPPPGPGPAFTAVELCTGGAGAGSGTGISADGGGGG